MTSLLCEVIYISLVLLIGIPIFGEVQMPLTEFAMIFLNIALIITLFCSIFNFITMICSEITVSTTANIFLFIAMFIAVSSLSLIADSDKYIKHTFSDETGTQHIISQELNPNYPGDQKVKTARIIYLSLPQGQAMEIGDSNTEYLYEMPIYSIILIILVNVLGLYIFSKKELK